MYISYKKRLYIYSRDNFTCQHCKKNPTLDASIKLSIDHIIPISKGGGNEIENLRVLCIPCNSQKKDRAFDSQFTLLQKKKLNIKKIFYPKQTAKDRINRINQGRCPIHGCEVIPYCSHLIGTPTDWNMIEECECSWKNCNIKIAVIDQSNFFLFKEFEHVLLGLYSPLSY